MRWRPSRGLDVAIEGRYVGKVFASDRRDAAAPAYSSFDLSAERRIDLGALQWRAFARINNLLDRDITGSVIVNEANARFFEPSPGRHWSVGVFATRIFGRSKR